MRLFTIQPLKVFETILADGKYICDYSKTNNSIEGIDVFKGPYEWLADEMAKRIGKVEGVQYPVWAWYRNDDDDFKDWGKKGEIFVKMTLKIDPSRVVLSDIDEWHHPLNGGPCIKYIEGHDDEFDAEYDACVAKGEEAIRATWSRIFDISESEYVQATFWELYASDIIEVETFVSTGPEYDDDDDDFEESA